MNTPTLLGPSSAPTPRTCTPPHGWGLLQLGGCKAQKRWTEVGVCPKLLPCCGALWRAGPQSHGRPLPHNKPGRDVPIPLWSRQHGLRDWVGARRPRVLRAGEWGSAVPGDLLQLGTQGLLPRHPPPVTVTSRGALGSFRVSPDIAPRTTGFFIAWTGGGSWETRE